jgi:hypothetical protein
LAATDRAIKALYNPADAKLEVAFAAVQGAYNQVENDRVYSLLAFVLESHAFFLLLDPPQQLHRSTSRITRHAGAHKLTSSAFSLSLIMM